MTTTLSTNLTKPAAATESFWVAMEQELPDALATVAEAAEVIDKLFELSPCTSAEEEEQTEEQTPIDEMLATAREIMAEELLEKKDTLCTAANGCFPATLLVFRSHQDRPYTMLVAGGEVTQTIIGNVRQMVKSVPVEQASSVSLDLPGDQPISASWQGPCYAGTSRLDSNPEITVNHGRLFWSGSITGVLRVSYPLPYDLVTIQTTEEDCTVTALYHLSTDEIDLQAPPADDQAGALCQHISSSIDLLDDDAIRPCTESIRVEVRCECTDEVSKSYPRYEDVACLPGEATGSVVNRGQVEVSYTACEDGDGTDVGDPKFYEEKCCNPPPAWMALPRCVKKHSVYSGGASMSEKDKQEIVDTYGLVNFIAVGPDDGICGEIIIEQDLNPKNCCDEVIPMEWNFDYSATYVSPNSSAMVGVTGGSGTYHWEIRGSGFYFDAACTVRFGTTSTPATRIYTKDACGSCTITVSDGCTETQGKIKSTDGYWEPVPESLWPAPTGIDHFDSFVVDSVPTVLLTVTEDDYKYTQQFSRTDCSNSTSCEFDSYAHACGTIEKSWDELKAAQLARVSGLVLEYISRNVFWQAHQEGARMAYCIVSRGVDASDWYDCGNGLLCAEGTYYAQPYAPHYCCTHAVNILVPIDNIQIWRWRCGS